MKRKTTRRDASEMITFPWLSIEFYIEIQCSMSEVDEWACHHYERIFLYRWVYLNACVCKIPLSSYFMRILLKNNSQTAIQRYQQHCLFKEYFVGMTFFPLSGPCFFLIRPKSTLFLIHFHAICEQVTHFTDSFDAHSKTSWNENCCLLIS